MEYFCQFVIGFASTAIGVVLALLLERWYDNIKDIKEADSIKAKLLIELINIQDTMLKIHNGSRTTLLLSPIKMPIFQGYVNSTKVALLDRYCWYNDLLSLYKYLDTYNSWQDAKTEKTFLLSENNLQTNNHVQINIFSAINKSLLTLEEIVLGKEFLVSETASCTLCKLEACDSSENKGLINCMIVKLSIHDGADLVKN